MHPQLQKLHQDHVNLSKVLHLLESLLADVRSGEHIDLDALSEIVDYVRTYPDMIHHKCEDVIFSVYLERSLNQSDLVGRLIEEHSLLLQKTHHLNEHIEEWRSDSPLPRMRVVSVIDNYLQMQWSHLNLEEGSVFHLLQQELTPGDWDRIEASMPFTEDPLFGKPTRHRFENIFDRLVAV